MNTNLTVAKDPIISHNSPPPRRPTPRPAPASHSITPEASKPTRAPPVTVSLTFKTIGPKQPPSSSNRYEKSPLDFSSGTKMSLDPNDTAYASFMQILHTRMETRNLPWDPEYARVNIKARMREPWSMFERAPVVVDARNWQGILEEARKGNLRGFTVYSEYYK